MAGRGGGAGGGGRRRSSDYTSNGANNKTYLQTLPASPRPHPG